MLAAPARDGSMSKARCPSPFRITSSQCGRMTSAPPLIRGPAAPRPRTTAGADRDHRPPVRLALATSRPSPSRGVVGRVSGIADAAGQNCQDQQKDPCRRRRKNVAGHSSRLNRQARRRHVDAHALWRPAPGCRRPGSHRSRAAAAPRPDQRRDGRDGACSTGHHSG